MTLQILRALFVLFMASIGYNYVNKSPGVFGESTGLALAFAVVLSVLVLAMDILSSRRKLLAFSGVVAGLLVGLAIAYILSFTVGWLVDVVMPTGGKGDNEVRKQLVSFFTLLMAVICCYLAISFIMQSKDDVRFIIPYVEFAKQSKGSRPMVLDTSALIDGRIQDIVETGVVDSRLVVPRFVLEELQALADCPDKLKRNRGRRGLEVLSKLQGNRKVDVVIYESPSHEEDDSPVDQRLLSTSAEMEARLLTTDFNLQKIAQVRGVEVINLNDLAAAMKPVVLPGERITVQLIKLGEQPGQAVGYLDDGTMVVVDQGRPLIGKAEVEATVTGVVQTSAGRMVFGQLGDAPQVARRGRRQIEGSGSEPPDLES